MATPLDLKIRPKVVEILAKYGTTVTLTDPGRSYVASTGAVSASPTNYSVRATPPTGVRESAIDGDRVREGDMTMILAGQGQSFSAPATGWQVTVGSETWQVVAWNPIYSGDLIAAFELILRK